MLELFSASLFAKLLNLNIFDTLYKLFHLYEPLSSLLNKTSSLESKLMSRKLFYMRYKSDLFQICSIPVVPVLQVRRVLQMDLFHPKNAKEKKPLN